ncbi:NTP transferase domain-containing protein [bacterium]|nr:MAG: NTP transferase domain-containing protein [bacterium]
MNFVTVIMAAGKGTRMKSDLAKVLHPLNGKPMIHYVIQLARDLGSDRVIAVIGHQKEYVKETLKNEQIEFVIQEPQLGTGHAVMQTEGLLETYDGSVLVLSGDVPMLTYGTMKHLIQMHAEQRADATVLTTHMPDPAGYGRVIRQTDQSVQKIVEHKDASDVEKQITEINSGIYLFRSRELFNALKKINSNNVQNEYYLPDVLNVLIHEKKKVCAYVTEDYREISGINTIEQLKEAEAILNSTK